jgi:hypothetical protein
MERYPEDWFWEPLDGAFAYSGVPYITTEESIQVYNISEYKRITYQCFLCDTGVMRSVKTLQQHVHGDKHQRLYQILKCQRQAWWLDQQVPDDFEHYDDSDDGSTILSYIMPFRRWHENQWKAGMSCRLCGTAALPTRWAVAEHCASSKRHALLRASTYLELHPECQELMQQQQQQQQYQKHQRLLPDTFVWNLERAMIHYVAAKEASFAGLASRSYEWYRLLRLAELLELRSHALLYLELAIWKQSLLRYDDDDDTTTTTASSFETLEELYRFLGHQKIQIEPYKDSKRVTCGITEILLGVLPFLRTIA